MHSKYNKLIPQAFFLLLFAGTQTAFACPVCFSAKEGTLTAYYSTTALLTFLPLLLIGSGVFWLFRRMKKLEESAKLEQGSPEGAF